MVDKPKQDNEEAPKGSTAFLHVGSSPHLSNSRLTTQRMMIDVLIGLLPILVFAIVIFRWFAILQLGICTVSCIAFEALFSAWRGKPSPLWDMSATVTGVILGLSMPWSAPWYIGVIASGVAIGIGKIVYGGLGQNIFNPAMVGRAFVMISFPAAMGAAAYLDPDGTLKIVTQATPMSVARSSATPLWPLFLGTVNGSLGEVSTLAALIGGGYLCVRRSASYEIPVGILGTIFILGGIQNLLNPDSTFTVLHHLFGGPTMFGAFFIATDPVTSPVTRRGKWIYGVSIGLIIMLIRVFSGYPEGTMFAVLLMNGVVPLINRWAIPIPVGGPVPVRAQ
ncbi:MAG: RnfABCDGE type electron transport complex subunit D [Verrucomicrobiota bacterium]|jgi:electron transport complex protein RnfD|nr:RnfABCDGE type electron transport complex subunit D [Verrucomicrobiota bacterium]MDD8046289.1 RnfABCDGE type electron transport complex subunit D [Verrucomicrobiota bacterium]MDD8050155.1 RnfABCDGE type electron transport complex subunit D [Verrucomicrobiota bacterium]MDI9383689.1 RnfABCDGE type electron transport complex subunit D [Verrucomicrobiota bacterium]HCF94735.1 electron transporter RnfD [Verrucomicrobiota bacterium]